jgi:5'-nucleotidase
MQNKFFVLLTLICLFSSCKKEYYLNKIEGKKIPVSDSIALNIEIDKFIKPFRDNLEKDMSKVLSYAPKTYHKKDGDLNTTIGNLMAHIVMEEGNPIFYERTGKTIDMVLLNHGGIRAPINKGNITTETAFQVMPFENSIVVVALKGQQVNSLVYYLSKAKKAHPIEGMKITINKNYNVVEALVNNQTIDKDKIYYVATNDYLYNGGDNMTFFKTNDTIYTLDYKIRNAMIDYFKKVDTINPTIDDRFTQTK